MQQERVADIFSKQNVLLTGATGFMGKALIEKLLRTCPDIGNIYVLTRPKRNETIHERWQTISKSIPFENVNRLHPGLFAQKVIPIAGNMRELGLGLSDEDRRVLQENVNLVVHSAATVRFNEALKEAILMNTRGTRELCALALTMQQIKLFIHISTAYAHTRVNPIQEIVYQAPSDWRQSIELAERLDKHEMQVIMSKILDKFPNTYTYSKSLGEQVVVDMFDKKLPHIIIRPSIVVHAFDEPLTGWLDNFNGPFALYLPAMIGVVRVVYQPNDNFVDYIPVDYVTNAMIAIIWNRLREKNIETTKVYNISVNNTNMTIGELNDIAVNLMYKYPNKYCIWYPTHYGTSNFILFYLYFMVLHLLVAFFLDGLLTLVKKPKFFYTLQKRYYIATIALQYFIHNAWRIENDNTMAAIKAIPDYEKANYRADLDDMDYKKMALTGIFGSQKFLLNMDPSPTEATKRRFKILYYVDRIVKFVFIILAFYCIFIKYELMQCIINKLSDI